MPEYLSPGVYVEEVPSGPRPIQGVGTSTAALVGQTERGPTSPRLITNWGDFVRWYGGLVDPRTSYLPFAARGFFENGGVRAFIARVTGAGAVAASRALPTQDPAGVNIPNNTLGVTAIGPGQWGNNLLLRVTAANQSDPNSATTQEWFRLTVLYYRDGVPTPFVDPTDPDNLPDPNRREPTLLEDFDNLTYQAGGSNFVESVVNANSRLISVASAAQPARPSDSAFLPVAAVAARNLATADANTELRFTAINAGAAGNQITVAVSVDPNVANNFEVTVSDGVNPAESHSAPDANPDQIINTINNNSALVQVAWVAVNAALPLIPSRPNDTAALALQQGSDGSNLAGGTNGAAIASADYIGNPGLAPDQRTGLAAIADIDEVALIAVPDEHNATIGNNAAGEITNALVDQCETLRDRFAILSVPAGQGQVQNILKARDTSYAAEYFPWIRVSDSRRQLTELVPPVGHVAGIYARSDRERGVHKAPANEVVRDMIVRDVSPNERPLQFHIGRGEHDILNPRGINVIRDFRKDGRGIRVWGARTLSSDPLWVYVNVRRLFLYVEESIDEGTQWVVFEPNEDNTWARVRQVIRNFLLTVWRSGALQGLTEEQAFFVRCGPETMTQADVDAGRLICEIGIAPVKPAEFVIFRIQQKTIELAA